MRIIWMRELFQLRGFRSKINFLAFDSGLHPGSIDGTKDHLGTAGDS